VLDSGWGGDQRLTLTYQCHRQRQHLHPGTGFGTRTDVRSGDKRHGQDHAPIVGAASPPTSKEEHPEVVNGRGVILSGPDLSRRQIGPGPLANSFAIAIASPPSIEGCPRLV